jgi:transposase
MTIQLAFTENDLKEIEYWRYHHPHPKIQKRFEALWLRAQGFKRNEILKVCKIGKTMFTNYLKMYEEKGIEGLKELKYVKQKSKLYEYKKTIEQNLKLSPPHNLSEASSRIESLTGLKRSNVQIMKFLKKIGIRCIKVGVIPAKADIEKQKEFLKKELEPRIKEAKQRKRVIFFVDAAHFVMGAFLGYIWSSIKLFIKSSSGRKRFNVLGALDSVNKKLITVTNDSYITAESVCELLKEIALMNYAVPITLVLDNARYQRCELVQNLAKKLRIELLFLPSYSPNLNLIERLWKFVKKKCLYSKYYEDFSKFKTAISDCLTKTDTEYKKELDKLITHKFQLFDKVRYLR